MPHRNDLYDAPRIIHGVNHTVITDANAPTIVRADKFTTPRRTRLVSQ
jgi:hypothetical protein